MQCLILCVTVGFNTDCPRVISLHSLVRGEKWLSHLGLLRSTCDPHVEAMQPLQDDQENPSRQLGWGLSTAEEPSGDVIRFSLAVSARGYQCYLGQNQDS